MQKKKTDATPCWNHKAPSRCLALPNPALVAEPVARVAVLCWHLIFSLSAPLPVMYKTQVCTMTHLVFVSSAGTAPLCGSLIVVTHVCSVLHDGGVCSLDHVLDPGGLWQGRMLPGQVQKPRSVAPIDVQVPWIRSPDAHPWRAWQINCDDPVEGARTRQVLLGPEIPERTSSTLRCGSLMF